MTASPSVFSPDGDDITDFSPEDQAYLLSKPAGFWYVQPAVPVPDDSRDDNERTAMFKPSPRLATPNDLLFLHSSRDLSGEYNRLGTRTDDGPRMRTINALLKERGDQPTDGWAANRGRP